MNQDEKFYCLGSGWISALGNGVFGTKPRFSNEATDFIYPELQEYIQELPPRFGRFDVYTKVSFAAAVLALKDAGLLQREGKKNIGIVVGSTSSVYDDDIAYFESTREAKGTFTSPNLFSYTLPNVALGEIAVYFGFIGPTFCVGNDHHANPGSQVFPAALSLLASRQCERILVGWVEVAQKTNDNANYLKGAAFSVLTMTKTIDVKAKFHLIKNIRFLELFKG